MKIIIANYRYFTSGGPERYMFNVANELSVDGHDIVPFSIKYSKNVETPYSRYFVEPLSSQDEVYFDQHKKSFKTISKTLTRLFYSSEVEKAVCRIVDEQQPQVAYVLHYLRKLSPSLLVGLKKNGIPIIVRLSDYAMLCPQAHCLRNGEPCTLCIDGKLLPSVKYKCIKNSSVASFLNLVATWFHRWRHYFDLIDNFVCTNQFMYEMMMDAGFPQERLSCIPTFTDTSYFHPTVDFAKSDYIVYSGRMEHHKGLHVLINALSHLKNSDSNGVQLKIAGTGNDQYANQCKDQVEKCGLSKVEFLGNIDSSKLTSLIGNALFSVVPSLWFENLPNTILESYACGTPVVASDIGSLSDCICDNETGFLFKTGNSEDLADKMLFCLENNALLKRMAIRSREEAEKKYSPDNHIKNLLHLFERFV